ncbi:MAG: hypothetical protein OXI66_03375, partial [Boseongicola sp.]|nr:hypothetical protein [Boseongicola sp.]
FKRPLERPRPAIQQFCRYFAPIGPLRQKFLHLDVMSKTGLNDQVSQCRSGAERFHASTAAAIAYWAVFGDDYVPKLASLPAPVPRSTIYESSTADASSDRNH